jgi:G:T/U-mismatch repair DNA glycosylase
MTTIKHKFRHFENQDDIEILILGTFNPDTVGNKAEFFYGRERNFLWNLLPGVYDQPVLKSADKSKKIAFSEKFRIGFADIIQELIVEDGNETNYADNYIDDKVTEWIDFSLFVSRYPKLKKVFFTRKTFRDIPNMSRQIDIIKQMCQLWGIDFFTLPTPARFGNQKKLNEWKTIINP